ncbi:DUF4127 family protein [Caproicibacter sp.]|uniref:DUF4127 family protein n=1 Tax=Caproicibacter sp. TaxID=2814884 RepID=UPI003989CF6F
MSKVLYVPLDERACNYAFPRLLAEMTDGIELLVPPCEMMGKLKIPADYGRIWQWVFQNAPACEYAILSVDTLIYGNIVNSRTHHRTREECEKTLENFRRLKKNNPGLKIHAFNLVARVAACNDSHEDPDYWAKYGRGIWRIAYLTDKIGRGHASDEEKAELRRLDGTVPEEYLNDFLARREVDRFTNLRCVDLVKEGVFDVLTIPKDDTAEYGYAAMDQAAIAKRVRAGRVMDRVFVYPGADEVGCVIFARVFNLIKEYVPRVYVRYSSTWGPTVVPLYEDRPLHESIKSQITSAGGIVEDCPDRSDCMLAVNSPGKYMIESMDQDEKDLTFTSHSNMHEFLRYIDYYARSDRKAVGLAEVSVCNGCENEFMDYAALSGVLQKVQAVGGWNTSQNTIGVVLAQTVIASYYNRFLGNAEKFRLSEEFKMRSIVCDWLYQANVLRSFLAETKGQIDPFALGGNRGSVEKYFRDRLNKLIREKFGGSYRGADIVIDDLFFQWDGVFYINLHVQLETIKPILE